MKTHFAPIIEMGNETNGGDGWGDAICGVDNISVNEMPVSNNWEFVDCKKCLKRKKQFEEEMEQAMEHNIRDMAGFVNFMEKDAKT